jgi:hypothetical protein
MAGFYRPRHPERTVLYRVLSHHFDRFLTEYESRFERESAILGPMRKGFSHNSAPRHRFLAILTSPRGRRYDSIVIRSGDLSPER